MKRNKIVWIIIAAAILIGAFITGREDHSIKVSVKKPVRGDITQSILTTGRVAASNQVTISSDVSGEITSLLVKEGDYVKKGDLIVKIKEETYLALVEKCRAEYNMTKERVNEELYRYELHRKNYERDSLLYDKDVITAEEFEKSRTEFYLAKSGLSGANFSVQSAEAALKDAQKQLEMTSIYSPISGTVIELSVSKGEKVVGTSQMAGTEIMKIADLEMIEIAAAVNEMDIPLLTVGDSVSIEIEAFPDKRWSGKVTHIAQNINKLYNEHQAGEYRIRVLFENKPQNIKSGMSAALRIFTRKRENVLKVPIEAIMTKEFNLGNENVIKEYVFIYLPESSSVTGREVVTGIQDSREIEIISGEISDSTLIVTGPYNTIQKELKEGLKVSYE